jgi:uncharacterized membrane protein
MMTTQRHVVKTISYRILGTTTTVLGTLWLGAPIEIASLLGITELTIKPILYFIHERIWYKYIKFGILKKD